MRGKVAKELRRASVAFSLGKANEIENISRGSKWFHFTDVCGLQTVLLRMHQRRWVKGCPKALYKGLKRIHKKYGPA